MTLKSAIQQMRGDEAAKRPSMAGYVFKGTEGLSEEEISEGKYFLVFVGKDGSKTLFPMGGLEDDGSTVSADRDFIENIIADNWDVAKVSDLESARSGNGKW